ncbi:MAG: hypothetical protein U0575_09990 [Phycisphaerales bacterium]
MPRCHSVRAVRGALCASASLAFVAPVASAVDLTVSSITVIQSVQYGSTALVGNRATMVRAKIGVTGTSAPVPNVDAILRVYVDGVEQAGSPACSLNGPLSAPTAPNLVNLDDTINFWVIVPESADVDFKVEVDPGKLVAETNENNNILQLSNIVFVCRDTVEIAYVPINYTAGGGLPEGYHMQPGIGDNFVRAIYAPGELNYHRSPLPPLTWTYDVNDTDTALLNALSDIRVNQIPAAGYPAPDFIFGWLPGNPYFGNGKSISIPGDAAFGNTDLPRYQRTFAHELGHLVGLVHNNATIGTNGIDVEHHLANTENIPQVFPGSKKDVMVAGQLTSAAFVNASSFAAFLNDPRVSCTADGGDLPPGGPPGGGDLAGGDVGPMLRVCGGVTHAGRTAWIDPVFRVPLARATPDDPTGDVAVVACDDAGAPLWVVRLDTQRSRESCAGGGGLAATSSVYALIPERVGGSVVASVDFFDLVDSKSWPPRTRSANALASRSCRSSRSGRRGRVARRPRRVERRRGGADGAGAVLTGSVRITWSAEDPDGDALVSHVLYSPDGGERWIPIAVDLAATSFDFDTAHVPATRGGTGLFVVRTSDGFNSTDSPIFMSAALGMGNPPDVYLVTPNDGDTFRQHAEVILHAAAWDLEDLMLDDANIVWTSSLDGVIGVGRMLLVDSLQPGTHVITVTGTDSDGMSGGAQVEITVTPRTVLGADLNLDGHVDGADIGLLLGSWGVEGNDLDGNGVVDGADLGVLLSAWN